MDEMNHAKMISAKTAVTTLFVEIFSRFTIISLAPPPNES
jgi:hypothetical protein